MGMAGGKHTRDIFAQQQQQQAADGGMGMHSQQQGQQGQEESGGIRMGKLRRAGGAGGGGGMIGGSLSPQQLEALRGAIQSLCANTQPLTRSMDFLAEDVEDMRAELRAWRNEYRKRGESSAASMHRRGETMCCYLFSAVI